MHKEDDTQIKTLRRFKFLLFLLLCMPALALPYGVSAAFLYISPQSGSFNVGGTLTATIRVDTSGASVNAAEGLLSFDPEKLSVSSISKVGSAFSLWTDEPAVASPGVLKFGGGTPGGFIGSAGSIFSVTFRVTAAGDTVVSFISGAVLAADGKGTNILQSLRGGNYSLSPSSVIPRVVDPVPVAAGTPAAPEITSATHPDPDQWYAKSTIELEWDVPSSIKTVRLLFNKLSTATPTINYSPPINKKTIDDIEDGSWYFHARFANGNGFGQVAHFPVRIDTTPPKQFKVTADQGSDPTNPSPVLRLNATDETSGIARYEIKVGDKESFFITRDDIKGGQYTLPPQEPGTRQILVKAIDRAGNFTPATVDVTIKPIDAPIITHYPER